MPDTREPAEPDIREAAVSDVSTTIMRICAESLSLAEVPLDANLVLLGVDSMTAVEIVTQIELELGVDVVETFFATPTVQAMTAAVERATAADTTSTR
ncbi:phosphopantetheine-binding protein [Streptomyces sp. UMAF16]|nr:phosphopantetheine-binding protein [Streptomyces sp. UMAF16]